MTDEARDLVGSVEAVLFAHGEPLSVERLAAICGSDGAAADEAVNALSAALEEDPARGLALLRHGASVQLVTHPRHGEAVARLLRGELSQDLGLATQETLALVAYFGPVTRAVIDHVRGVSSAVSLRTLMVRGLIERTREGKGEHAYQATPELLREMGITRREALPDFDELSGLLARSLAARDAASSESQPEEEA